MDRLENDSEEKTVEREEQDDYSEDEYRTYLPRREIRAKGNKGRR